MTSQIIHREVSFGKDKGDSKIFIQINNHIIYVLVPVPNDLIGFYTAVKPIFGYEKAQALIVSHQLDKRLNR